MARSSTYGPTRTYGTVSYSSVMNALDARPWLSHYPPGVPEQVEIPDEPHGAALESAARRWPDRAAIDFFGASLTYAQLAARTRTAAAAFWDLGVRHGH